MPHSNRFLFHENLFTTPPLILINQSCGFPLFGRTSIRQRVGAPAASGLILRSIIARWKIKALCHLRPYPRGPLRLPKQVERAAIVSRGENYIQRAWSTSTATEAAPASAPTGRRWRG